MSVLTLTELVKRSFAQNAPDAQVGGQGRGGVKGRGVITGEAVRRHEACGICGRTVLTGELAEVYTDPEGADTFVVCTICRPEARQLGFKQEP